MGVLANARHERFAQELAKGQPADAAYEAAGFAPNRGNASTLKAKQNIQDRVAEILGGAAEAVGISKQWVIDQLVENVERAMQKKAILGDEGEEIGIFTYQGSVANKSLELLGKELGMFVERRKEEHHVMFEQIERVIIPGKANGHAVEDRTTH